MFCPSAVKTELPHLEKVLMRYKYPKLAINKVLSKQENMNKPTSKGRIQQIPTSKGNATYKCHTHQGYVRVTSPSETNMVSRYTLMEDTLWNIFWYQLKIRTLLWRKAVSYTASNITRLNVKMSTVIQDFWRKLQRIFKRTFRSVDNFKIIDREGHNMSRTIKEAINITVNITSLNKNIGKDNLPHTWNKILTPH